jgi:2-dehydropantoate 2-reductase
VDRLVAAFKDCLVEHAEATSNIWGYLWGKEGFGAMLFAGAVMDIAIADLLAEPENRNLLADIAGEVVRVADAEGVRCEAFDGYDPTVMRFAKNRDWDGVGASLAQLERRYRQSLKPKSGIWRDLVIRRRRTEVDAQLGIVSTIGAQHGIATPLIDRVVAMIHEIEDGTRRMDPANLAELRALDRACYPEGTLPA